MTVTMQPGDIVSWWVYMATDGLGYAQQALCYGKVLSVGAKRVTLVTEYGYRTWKHIEDVTLSPEGAEYFKDHDNAAPHP